MVCALLDKDKAGVDDVLMTGAREGNVALVGVAIEKGGLKAETLTSGLTTATGGEKKTEIVAMLKKAGAVPPPEIDAATLRSYVGKYKGDLGPASPVASDGKNYLPSSDGDVFVVKAGAKHELLATNSVGEVMMATPAISNGLVIVRGSTTCLLSATPHLRRQRGSKRNANC
jgi:hypothetical protein